MRSVYKTVLFRFNHTRIIVKFTCCLCFFFFFQAEDGIRDWSVTGVQTCALPICLLVVYVPVYQRKAFCLQEYTAMERIQRLRYEELKKDLSGKLGMILPLVYTGEDAKIPAWISGRINYKSISQFTVSGPETVFEQD